MDHGILPVPAPATAVLLEGVPIAATNETGELTTPTGAAILTTIADSFGPLPAMTPTATGYGAGTRDGTERPNLLRVMLGNAGTNAETDEVVILEANIDDCTAEVLAHCLDRLLNAGALDAYCLPIYMKKSRPGTLVTVISSPADVDRLEALIFAETTTFGVRRTDARRSKLSREHQTVQTPLGAIRIKVGSRGGQVITAAPEFEDCRQIAQDNGLTLKEVMTTALRVWEKTRS
jgi:uncharacterized protein (TIGR00299 family) protein